MADDTKFVIREIPSVFTVRFGRVVAAWQQVILGSIAALLVTIFWMVLEWRTLRVPLPFEDAAMLFRYADNLAGGGGLAWNAGETPGLTDGATDLGFVLALSPLIKLGLGVTEAAIVVNLLGIAGIGALIGLVSSQVWRTGPRVALIIVALVASGPSHRYVLSGFSPPVLGFLLLLVFTSCALGQRHLTRLGSASWFGIAGVFAGLAGWWRPEGFALALLAAIAALMVVSGGERLFNGSDRDPSMQNLAVFLGPFSILVLGWVVFRLSYFDQLLPTSVVMKGSSGLHWGNALFSFQFLSTATLPLIGLLIVAGVPELRNRWLFVALIIGASLVWINGAIPPQWWSRFDLVWVPELSNNLTKIVLVPLLLFVVWMAIQRGSRVVWAVLVFIAFSGIWVLTETTLNWWSRMQWPVVPLLSVVFVSVSLPALSHQGRPRGSVIRARGIGEKRSRSVALGGLAVFPIVLFHLPWGGYEEFPFHTSVARVLADVDTSGVRVASTEAGLIPMVVSGDALDPWGHNNRAIAAQGQSALEKELQLFEPNLIVVHGVTPIQVAEPACKSIPANTGFGPFAGEWIRMSNTLYEYADEHGFELLRSTETGDCEAWSVFVGKKIDPDVSNALRQYRFAGRDLIQ